MKIFDIHSHILPAVDDGPTEIEASLQLLSSMKAQGITDVIATPHFIATHENFEEYISKVNSAYTLLKNESKYMDLPNIHLGSEVFYFKGIGKISNIKNLTLCNSDYILLELPFCPITDTIVNDIMDLSENLGLTPIIAHIERYTHLRGFKKILGLVSEEIALAQINCSSVLDPYYKKTILKLINKGFVSFMATDAHSLKQRPPMMDKALKEIEEKFGVKTKQMLIDNSNELYNKIVQEENFAI